MTPALIALGAAIAMSPALADQDYPPGLFENSPVVPHGQQYQEAPSAPGVPDADSAPGYDGPPGPGPYAPPPGPEADAPPPGYCAGIAGRTFGSLEEVRRAHALCDRLRAGPPTPGY